MTAREGPGIDKSQSHEQIIEKKIEETEQELASMKGGCPAAGHHREEANHRTVVERDRAVEVKEKQLSVTHVGNGTE